jgi:signal transduction histidine kinase
MAPERANGRDWPLLLGPQAFAGWPEGAIFSTLCVLMLLLVSVAELAAPRHATLGAIAFIPVVAGGWLLSRRWMIVVISIAVALRALATLVGPVDLITALAQVITLPIVGVVARLAAVSTVRLVQSEARLSTVSRERTRAAELEQAKSDFMRMASHELRGPVAVLRGYLSMLADGSLGRLPEPAEQVMPMLISKLQAMNRLVEDMLETARLEDSRMQLKKQRLDAITLVTRVVETARKDLPDSHKLELDVPRRPVEVEVDGDRVATILGNLIDNAVKYSPKGGKVRCAVKPDRGRALISISDQGLGIDKENQATLFTRFGRVLTPDNSGIPGTGLGLYLSRQLARLHGGDIRVDSQRGKGSTFTLELPLAEARPELVRDREPERQQQREIA